MRYLCTPKPLASDSRIVERQQAFDLLPEAYAKALRLLDEGAEQRTIAEHLGIEHESVGPLLEMARAKLAPLVATNAMTQPRKASRTLRCACFLRCSPKP